MILECSVCVRACACEGLRGICDVSSDLCTEALQAHEEEKKQYGEV